MNRSDIRKRRAYRELVAVALWTRWALLPRWARLELAIYVLGFAEGTGDHIRWMVHGGIHAYAAAYPAVPIQALFVALIVLDPLTAVLAGIVRRAGIVLAVVIMVADMIANWFGNWPRITGDPGQLLSTAPWVITAFGVFVLATGPALWRAVGVSQERLDAEAAQVDARIQREAGH